MLNHDTRCLRQNLGFLKNSMKTALKLFLTPTLCAESFDKSMEYCQIHVQVYITVKRFQETLNSNILCGLQVFVYFRYLFILCCFCLLTSNFCFQMQFKWWIIFTTPGFMCCLEKPSFPTWTTARYSFLCCLQLLFLNLNFVIIKKTYKKLLKASIITIFLPSSNFISHSEWNVIQSFDPLHIFICIYMCVCVCVYIYTYKYTLITGLHEDVDTIFISWDHFIRAASPSLETFQSLHKSFEQENTVSTEWS